MQNPTMNNCAHCTRKTYTVKQHKELRNNLLLLGVANYFFTLYTQNQGLFVIQPVVIASKDKITSVNNKDFQFRHLAKCLDCGLQLTVDQLIY